MKKCRLSYILHFIFPIILLGGCTLSMEDFSIPEEERGMDEAYTEETPFGEVTYQFADSVFHLTEHMQEQYLIRVDEKADSVIYLSDALPKNYRPYVGQKIYAGFGYNFPLGFSGRVLAVEDMGGIYKVTTTAVTKDDVFKELNYSFDYEGMVENTSYVKDLDDEILDRLGYQRLADSTIVDWSVYDSVQAANGNEKAKARIRRRANARTRAMDKDGNGVEDRTEVKQGLEWTFDTRTILSLGEGAGAAKTLFMLDNYKTWYSAYEKAVKSANSKWESWHPYIALDMSVKHYIHSHTERDTKRDYECNWNETWDVYRIMLDMGFSNDFAEENTDYGDLDKRYTFYEQMLLNAVENDGDAKAYRKQYKELVNEMKPKKGRNEANGRKDGKLPIKGFKFGATIPLGPWFSIRVGIEGTPTLELAGCFTAEMELTTAKRKSGTITVGDTETHISEETAPGQFKIVRVGGKVSLKLGYTFRAGVDFLVCNTAGISIGANLETAFVAEGGLDIYTDEEGEERFKFSGSLKFSVDFWTDLTFLIEPLGFSLWQENIADFPDPHVHILYKSWEMSPQVTFGTGYYEAEDGEMTSKMSVIFTNLDAVYSLLTSSSYPMMRMYQGPIEDNKYVYMWPVKSRDDYVSLMPDDIKRATTNKEYFFYYNGPVDVTVNEIHFVPTIASFDTHANALTNDWNLNAHNYKDSEIEVDDEYPIEIGEPSIATDMAQQTYGGPCTDFDALQSGEFINADGGSLENIGGQSIDPDKLSMYKFMSKLRISNATRMLSCGLKVYIYNKNKKQIRRVKIPIRNPKSGVYTYQFHFVTDWLIEGYNENVSTDECLYFRVIPYWTDQLTGQEVKAADKKSTTYYKIEFRKELVDIDGSNTGKWGTVVPEIDLDK